MTKDLIVAEPLYIILARLGHPNAHEKVRTLTSHVKREKRSLEEIILNDQDVQPYLEKMTPRERNIISNPRLYTGIAAEKARKITERWTQKFGV